MKKSQLKSLIKRIIQESLSSEGQAVGGVKNDHEFDAGRSSVMKAVNIGEKVGFDGKYVDDMQSGVAVKKLHNLDEVESYKRGVIYPQNFKSFKNYIRLSKNTATDEFIVLWYENGKLNEDKSYFTSDIKDAYTTFVLMKKQVDKENSTVNEETGTGAVAGYQTPYAFSKKKDGSAKAIASAKKYGTVVKSISEKK